MHDGWGSLKELVEEGKGGPAAQVSYRVVLGGAVAGLAAPLRVMLRFVWCKKKTFAKTIQPVAIRRESQSVALLVRAEGSTECNRRSIDATGDQRVGFGFPVARMPRTL